MSIEGFCVCFLPALLNTTGNTSEATHIPIQADSKSTSATMPTSTSVSVLQKSTSSIQSPTPTQTLTQATLASSALQPPIPSIDRVIASDPTHVLSTDVGPDYLPYTDENQMFITNEFGGYTSPIPNATNHTAILTECQVARKLESLSNVGNIVNLNNFECLISRSPFTQFSNN